MLILDYLYITVFGGKNYTEKHVSEIDLCTNCYLRTHFPHVDAVPAKMV